MGRREELNYFDVFIKNAGFVYQEAMMLRDYLEDFNASKSQEIEEKVHTIEHTADISQHEILNYLVKDFVPPIDREDIIMLCHEIDNAVDMVDELVININIYNITKLQDDINDYIMILNEMTDDLVELMKEFKAAKKREQITPYVVKINNTEEKGDALFQKSIKNIYQNLKDPIEVIKWTTIYNCFENCFDAIENVTDVVDEVMMKNS